MRRRIPSDPGDPILKNTLRGNILLAPTGALVFILVYHIPAGQPSLSDFSDFKYLKDPTCATYISDKHWIQGYQLWHSRVS